MLMNVRDVFFEMSVSIVIDGYNMIRGSFWLNKVGDGQLSREALIDALAIYKKLKGHRIIVVFDGVKLPFMYGQRDKIKGIEVRYSNDDETADQLINEIVAKEKHRVMVVSCDREIISYAKLYGASVVKSSFFEEKVIKANLVLDGKFYNDMYDCNSDIIKTRKKGPKKRLSKSTRKYNTKLSKL